MFCSPVVDIRDEKKYMHAMRNDSTSQKEHMATPNFFVADDGKISSIRNTQYSMQSFDLPSRESPRPPQKAGVFGNLDGPLPNFLQKVSHGEPYGGEWFPGSAAGLGNLETPYDTDMSGGQPSSRPSPGNTSSNTSYSPHSQNADIGSSMPKPAAYQPADLSTGTPKFFNFTNADGNFVSAMPSQPQQQTNANLDLSASSWTFDPTGASPSNFTTGMTPGAEGEWNQILDNMNWDSTLLDTNNNQWGTSPGGT